jgi:hypothetical protein
MTYANLASAEKAIALGDTRSFYAMIHCDSSDKLTEFRFDVVRNDARAFVVTRQWQPGRYRYLRGEA